jgi:hypothetical protein
MARVALLIGTENYGTEFGRLEATPRNVHALAAVLENPLMGGFDSVEKLIDPDHSKMGETIETWLRSRDKKDLILLYIAGHGIKDVARQLYFAASTSRKVEGELVTWAQIEKDGFLNNPVGFSIILRIKSIRSADLATSSANKAFLNHI